VVDLSETKHHVLVDIQVPGLAKDQIKLKLTGNHLEISAEVEKRVYKDNGTTCHYQESSYGKLYRAVKLPASTDLTVPCTAALTNGILRVTFTTKATPTSQDIQIS
jgi:HSP20 family protein